MKFGLRYSGGNIPKDKYQEVSKKWQDWYAKIKPNTVFRAKGGKLVSSNNVSDYRDELKGVLEIIEAKSLDDAAEKTKGCPGIPYGMKVEVLEEYPSG